MTSSSTTSPSESTPQTISPSISNFPGLQITGMLSHPLTTKLDATNFLQWRQQALAAIRGNRMMDFIKGPLDFPTPEFLTTTDCTNGKVNEAFITWIQLD